MQIQGLMRHDELRDMGCLMPMKKEADLKHRPHFLKTNYCYKVILNLQSQPHKTKQNQNK